MESSQGSTQLSHRLPKSLLFRTVPVSWRNRRYSSDPPHDRNIYHQQRIASHRRSFGKQEYTTLAEHMPPGKLFFADWDSDRFVNWAAKIGPCCRRWFSWFWIAPLLSNKPIEPASASWIKRQAFKPTSRARLSASATKNQSTETSASETDPGSTRRFTDGGRDKGTNVFRQKRVSSGRSLFCR